jgi:hypothetical protein
MLPDPSIPSFLALFGVAFWFPIVLYVSKSKKATRLTFPARRQIGPVQPSRAVFGAFHPQKARSFQCAYSEGPSLTWVAAALHFRTVAFCHFAIFKKAIKKAITKCTPEKHLLRPSNTALLPRIASRTFSTKPNAIYPLLHIPRRLRPLSPTCTYSLHPTSVLHNPPFFMPSASKTSLSSRLAKIAFCACD